MNQEGNKDTADFKMRRQAEKCRNHFAFYTPGFFKRPWIRTSAEAHLQNFHFQHVLNKHQICILNKVFQLSWTINKCESLFQLSTLEFGIFSWK